MLVQKSMHEDLIWLKIYLNFRNFSCIFLTKTVSISTAYILLLAFENSPFRKEAAYHVLLELNLKRNFPAVYFANKSVLKERFRVLKY